MDISNYHKEEGEEKVEDHLVKTDHKERNTYNSCDESFNGDPSSVGIIPMPKLSVESIRPHSDLEDIINDGELSKEKLKGEI